MTDEWMAHHREEMHRHNDTLPIEHRKTREEIDRLWTVQCESANTPIPPLPYLYPRNRPAVVRGDVIKDGLPFCTEGR